MSKLMTVEAAKHTVALTADQMSYYGVSYHPMPQLERPFRFNGYNKPTPVASCGKCSGCLNAAVVRQMEGRS